jgi:hypothetical protein
LLASLSDPDTIRTFPVLSRVMEMGLMGARYGKVLHTP